VQWVRNTSCCPAQQCCSSLLLLLLNPAVRSPWLLPLLLPVAKTHYGTSLANVDWLHGTAESLLTVTNLLIGAAAAGMLAAVASSVPAQSSIQTLHSSTPVEQQQHSSPYVVSRGLLV
jgi:hypothetical protein